jgi:hypothetical protein
MKKLSELVNYKNQLDRLSTREAEIFATLELRKFTQLLNNPNLDDKLGKVSQAFAEFNAAVDDLNHQLKAEIDEAQRPWFQESYRLHDEEMSRFPVEHILKLCDQVHQPVKEIIKSRLNLYSSWHHAAVFLRPGKEDFINQLVSFNPLYILDRTQDLIAPGIAHFSEAYKNRLRQYAINDVNNDNILKQIPNGQIALFVSYMYFDCTPFEIIKQYFTEIYQKLKPGGILGFTFNDCDYAAGVKLAEQHARCFTPGYLIKELAQSVGFEIVYNWRGENEAVGWLELKKPGNLDSIKGGQTLAKIIPKQL